MGNNANPIKGTVLLDSWGSISGNNVEAGTSTNPISPFADLAVQMKEHYENLKRQRFYQRITEGR